MFHFCGAAYAEVINFDQGIDTKEIASHFYDGNGQISYDGPVVPAPITKGRYAKDCVRFSFGPSKKDMLSQKVRLRSVEYI